jgi:hypothetical protein
MGFLFDAIAMLLSMIVDDFDLVGVAAAPTKTNSPLVVDADTVLTGSVAVQQFEAIAGRNPQFVERNRRVQYQQFPQGGPLQCSGQPSWPLPPEDCSRFLVCEVPYQDRHPLVVRRHIGL